MIKWGKNIHVYVRHTFIKINVKNPADRNIYVQGRQIETAVLNKYKLILILN